MTDIVTRLRNPPFGTETSERNMMALAADEIERLRAALTDAIETVNFWASYASDYFKDKQDLEGDLTRLRAALKSETR